MVAFVRFGLVRVSPSRLFLWLICHIVGAGHDGVQVGCSGFRALCASANFHGFSIRAATTRVTFCKHLVAFEDPNLNPSNLNGCGNQSPKIWVYVQRSLQFPVGGITFQTIPKLLKLDAPKTLVFSKCCLQLFCSFLCI